MARKKAAEEGSDVEVDAGAGPGPIEEAKTEDTVAGDLGQGTAPAEAPKAAVKVSATKRGAKNPVINEKENPIVRIVQGDRRRTCRKVDLAYFKERGYKLEE